MPRSVRRSAGALGAIAMVLGIGVQSVSAIVLWTMTGTPLTAVAGVATTFTFTATNLDPLLGIKCVVAEIPKAINPGDVWIAGSSTDAGWVATRSGQLVTAVIDSGDGNEKLTVGEWVSFSVVGTAREAGTYAVPAVAYSSHSCLEDARILAAPPVIVISEPILATPTPTPEASPTPTPTPIIALPTLPPVLPTATPRPTPVPTHGPTPSPAPTATPAPTPSPSPDPSPSPTLTASPSTAGAGGALFDAGPPGAGLLVRPVAPEGPEAPEVGLGPLGVIDGVSVWAVPGAIIAGPGLVVILWVALQAGAAAAWLPAIRRMHGGDEGGAWRRRLAALR